MQWHFLNDTIPNNPAALEEVLLANRNIIDSKAFFKPKSSEEISIEEVGIDLEQLRLAKERLLEAIDNQQKILVFGDYDADGVCAAAVMWEALHDLGADALPFIPHREKHGYGLTWAAIEELKKHPLPDLIITVDTGITAVEPIKGLIKEGVEVIITDHHQPDAILPDALAIVHTPAVSGAAVAWFLARELNEAAAKRSLDLVAIAAISDLMPLRGINRSLVFHGLPKIKATQRPGLKALMEVAGFDKKPLDAGTVGYGIAPRLNAMGRLSHGLDALRLLCTKSAKQAKQLANLVDETNADRQQLTEDLLQLAKRQALGQKERSLIIAHSPDFHEGVIGLIAGKLAEWYAKPTIVISTTGTTAKASARSVPGVNITELIRTGREHLLEVGGHPMAAGFGFEVSKLDEVMNYLYEHAQESIDPELLQKKLDIECLLPLKVVNQPLMAVIEKFAPFGQQNPRPVFALQDVKISDIQTVGAQQQHLKLVLQDADSGSEIPVLAWGKGEAANNLTVDSLVNVAGVLETNEWRNKQTIQLILRDLQPS